MTYLYYPTLAGVKALGTKAILIPTAHDEPPFWFLIVKRLLQSARVVVPNTLPEAGLIARQLAGAAAVVETAGLGFDETVFSPSKEKAVGAPYVLYLGRISEGKGVGQLIAWFQAFCAKHPDSTVRLCLAGHREASIKIPADSRIEYLGFVDDEKKLALLRGATALVNPSPHESMSMIVIEAMAMNVPVLVNRHCEVLRYYTEQTRTVFGFGSEGEFVEAFARVLQTPWREAPHASELEATRAWALARFSWRHVLGVFAKHVAEGKSLRSMP
jgi:glycosyltransferase involved in cell wall biosynthesis